MTSSKKRKRNLGSEKNASISKISWLQRFDLSFDSVAAGVLAILALLVSATVLLGEGAGIQVRLDLPEDGIVGPYQPVTLTFSESFDPEMTSDLIFFDPVHEGYLEWVDTYTMRFVPLKPYERDLTYKVNIGVGEVAVNGREVKQAQTWNFTIREPLVVYMLASEGESGIWTIGLQDDAPKRLTDESIKVMSFDAAQSGEFVIFASINLNGGVDLWRVSREGGDEALLLDCGYDRCTTPVISPDGKRIAYSREAAGPTPDIPFGSPRVWVVDLENGSDAPVYEDQQILGYNPVWSPDSNKLASFDGLADTIHVIDFQSGQQFIFSSNTGGPMTWSPDSNKLLYTTFSQDNGGRTLVRMADVSINETMTLIGQNDTYDYSYYSVEWSPLNERAILSLRADESQFTQSLWVFNPGLLDGILIADDPNYTYNSPSWDPWGNALVFQQFNLRGQYKPEISFWQSGMTEPTVIAEGILPQWLP